MNDQPAPRDLRSRAVHLGLALALLVLVCACGAYRALETGSHDDKAAPAAPPPAVAAPVARSADFGSVAARADVHRVADWVLTSADHGTRPFAVVDKNRATLYVFAPTGRLIGASPVLLGLARGDDSEPGIGDKPIAAIRPEERTTPAGRFEAEGGRNIGGENVIWVDYDAAVSMHSVRANVASERRLERLKSPDPAEHRISYGCINVPADFFARVAWPSFAKQGGMIYVLPETRALAEVFPALRNERTASTR
jgi:hypothetical protein